MNCLLWPVEPQMIQSLAQEEKGSDWCNQYRLLKGKQPLPGYKPERAVLTKGFSLGIC